MLESILLGMIVACLIKEIQVSTELRKMSAIHLLPEETVRSLIAQKFEASLGKLRLPGGAPDEDPLVRGEFEVIKELLEKVGGSVTMKR